MRVASQIQRRKNDGCGLIGPHVVEILERIGKASKVISPLGSISCGQTKASLGTLITADMVGTRIGAREGFRNFRFTAKKGA